MFQREEEADLTLDGEVSKQGWPRYSGSSLRKAAFPLRRGKRTLVKGGGCLSG